MPLKHQHFLSIDQLGSLTTIDLICELAARLSTLLAQKQLPPVLSGAILANLFFEASTRTRLSFAAAFNRLGGAVIEVTDPAVSSIAKGESLADTSRVISGYADIMVLRHPDVSALAQFAQAAQVPVINAGNGVFEHPTQALVDLHSILTELGLQQSGQLTALNICLVGDLKHGRTVHSLTKLLSLFGKRINFSLVAPTALRMPLDIIKVLKNNHSQVSETDNLHEGVANADVVYMTRIQQERFANAQEASQYAGKYVIDRRFYQQYCLSNPILMHPLPRDSQLNRPEIDPDLNDHPKLAIFRQAQNALVVRMALFCLLLGVEDRFR